MSTSPSRLKLYHYWRSSSSWRVRWAFALKGVKCEFASINLLTDEPESETHRQRNPLGFVPVLEFLDTPTNSIRYLGESVAMIEWVEEAYPNPSLFPSQLLLKARARQLAEMINSGTQPLQNPGVSAYFSDNTSKQKEWSQYWIRNGLKAYETLVQETAGKYSIGDQVTYPDLFLIPQCYNALRNEIQIEEFPTIQKIYKNSRETAACQAASPEQFQPLPV